MQPLQYIFPIACSLLLGITAFSLRSREDRRSHPFFLVFCVFDSVAGLMLLLLQLTSTFWYFYSYWAVEILSSLLLILSIQELANGGKKQLPEFARFVTFLFYGVAICAMMVAIWEASRTEAEEFYRIIAGVVALDQGLRLLQASLLLFVIGMFKRFSLIWTEDSRAVVSGAALLTSGELLVTTLRLSAGKAFDQQFFYLRPTAFLLGCSAWALLLLKRKHTSNQNIDVSLEVQGLARLRTALERLSD
jgi:hypothetical protein